ncbi:MAG TPA: hypothetical protein VG937_03515 [Polyangiaceae bacterium]|jgi:hypothetical protein|nr:hypothetical protein [Polyangiaceae bacterium]
MKRLIFALFLPTLLTACPREREQSLTLEQASQALEESTAASEAEGLTASSVDISTHFTIGQGAETAASELRAFVASQLPCAELSLEAATLTIEYGANPGACSYRGRELSGTSKITVARNDAGQIEVDHEWIELSNGFVTLNGTAHVTWDGVAKTRHVQHDTIWTHLASGRVAHGSGDRTQTALDGDASVGIQVDGARSWQGDRGTWDLAINGVQMRWADPLPQAGSYTLATPFDKDISVAFSRKDEDTIRVTVTGPKRSFSFSVSKLGVATREP